MWVYTVLIRPEDDRKKTYHHGVTFCIWSWQLCVGTVPAVPEQFIADVLWISGFGSFRSLYARAKFGGGH